MGRQRIPIKIPNLAKWDKSQSGNSQPSSLIGTCLTLPNLGFFWVFFKYPKISKNGNLLFFPVCWASHKISVFTARAWANIGRGWGGGGAWLPGEAKKIVYIIFEISWGWHQYLHFKETLKREWPYKSVCPNKKSWEVWGEREVRPL